MELLIAASLELIDPFRSSLIKNRMNRKVVYTGFQKKANIFFCFQK
jgi:hypothetical protein